jgi:phosphate-selective porin OprO and OprP
MPLPRPLPRSLLALALAIATTPAFAADEVTVEDLARRLKALELRLGTSPSTGTETGNSIADLDQRLRLIERKLELQAEADANRTASTPVVSFGDKGLSLKSPPPGDSEMKFRGLLQADGRFWFGDSQVPQNDTFLLRRIEPTIEGTWGPLVGYRLTAQFAGDSATINDAYVDLKFDPRATLRIGKTKTPVGLERLQSSGSTEQVETGFPSELAPGRDIGMQLQGEFAALGTSYALGLYNGTADGRDGSTTNPDGDFDVVGRLFLEPWKDDANALSGLGFGIAASRGEKHGSGNNVLPRYRTPGQVQFFGYRSDVLADGEHVRWSPQAYFYRGRFGLLAEYIASRQELLAPATGVSATLDNRAWQVSSGVVLTGEDAGYRGVARPNHPFTTDGPGWGALELVARYGRLEIDGDAFPVFADPVTAPSGAHGWSVGVNWYLTANFKLVADYSQTAFDAAPDGPGHEDEKVFLTRAQFSF